VNNGQDISNWKLVQANASYTYFLPAGTVIPANGYVVVGRNATQADFEAFWGVTLPGNVVYINSAGAFPVVNGSENYTLYNAAGTLVDGTTISMSASAGQSIQRKDPCLAANLASSWNVLASSSGTPGSGAGAGCGKGVVINEFSDALGTGNYVYEFIEPNNDR
jgi:Lamin Tail Domain